MKQLTSHAADGPLDIVVQAGLGSTSHEVATVILSILHSLTYLPLVLLPILQDAHLKLAVVLNTSLCLCLMAGNLCFQHLGIVKVFPKMLDTFLLVLYASMVPVVLMQFSWLSDWINVYHNGAVACFVWLTIILPCWESFATEALRDRVSEHFWGSADLHQAGLKVSQVWGVALTLGAIAALPPVLLSERRRWAGLHVVCDYVLVLLLILAAAVLQWRTTVRLVSSLQNSSGDVEVGVTVQPAQVRAPPVVSAATPAAFDSNTDHGQLYGNHRAPLSSAVAVAGDALRLVTATERDAGTASLGISKAHGRQ